MKKLDVRHRKHMSNVFIRYDAYDANATVSIGCRTGHVPKVKVRKYVLLSTAWENATNLSSL